AMTTVIRSRR
ncbi:response regulator, partial [Vibrio parahaemolyticus V-223/04]